MEDLIKSVVDAPVANPRWTGQKRPFIDRQNRPFPPGDRDE